MIYLWMNNLDQCCEVDQRFIEKIQHKRIIALMNIPRKAKGEVKMFAE